MDRERRAKYIDWLRKGILAECVLVLLLAAMVTGRPRNVVEDSLSNNTLSIENDYIKWVDFTVSYEQNSIPFHGRRQILIPISYPNKSNQTTNSNEERKQ